MTHSVMVSEIRRDRAFYLPGEDVHLQIHLTADHVLPTPHTMIIEIRHLNSVVDTIEKSITLSDTEQVIEVSYSPPPEAPRGYGVDLRIADDDGGMEARSSAAFDVLHHWTQYPRYGFLTDFFPGRSNYADTIESLVRFHINGLQFYDWMYRHDQFMVDKDPYDDPLGRILSIDTVNQLISTAHNHNIAAMPYTAIYASSTEFYQEHKSWALYKASGDPFLLGENFLVYMDPRPESPWAIHLLGQFDDVLQNTRFDGIHLDQYGDPKDAYDYDGNRFSLGEPLAATINNTKDLVLTHRPDGSVVFNAVTNWPIESVATSKQDFSYIEVWPPYTWFTDLHQLITQAQVLSKGKPVVLAAYLDQALEHNVRLVDAIIFASGAGHIELGEIGGMLAHEYFPNYLEMSSDMSRTMEKYYSFAVRYQDVIGPGTIDTTRDYHHRIDIEGVYTGPDQRTNKVWPIVRENDNCLAISLINLNNVTSPNWADPLLDPPKSLRPTSVRVYFLDNKVSEVWMASPDLEFSSPIPIDFELMQDRNGIKFEIPSLEYWDLIVLEWEK